MLRHTLAKIIAKHCHICYIWHVLASEDVHVTGSFDTPYTLYLICYYIDIQLQTTLRRCPFVTTSAADGTVAYPFIYYIYLGFQSHQSLPLNKHIDLSYANGSTASSSPSPSSPATTVLLHFATSTSTTISAFASLMLVYGCTFSFR